MYAVIALACGSPGKNELGFLAASVRGDMQYSAVDRVRFDAALDNACGRGGLTARGEDDLPRWPYLQKVTSDAAEVLFTSAVVRPFRVRARTPEGKLLSDVPAAIDSEARPSAGTQYVASLQALPASSTICYELVADDETFTLPTGFRTAPDRARAATARFVALGDLGTVTSDQLAVLEQLEQVPFDLMVLTGDVAYESGTAAEFDRNFFGVYRNVLGQVPAFPASGNHDYSTDDARPFREAFSLFENGTDFGKERWYSFDWGPVHFVFLDTQQLVDAQIQWLDQDLGAHDRPWTVVIAHRPPYSAGDHGSEPAVREAFSPIFAAHQVPLVLLGHEHNYERTKPLDGVVYVVTGGGGRGTRAVGKEAFTQVIERVAHFVWVEADDQQLRLVAIDATGQAFDSVGFQRPSPLLP